MVPFAAIAVVALLLLLFRLVNESVDGVRAEMAALADESEAILKGADATGREISEEEAAKIEDNSKRYDELKAKLAGLEAKVAERARLRGNVKSQAEWLNTSQGRSTPPGSETPLAVSSGHHDRLLDDPARGFSSFGEFALQVHAGCVPDGAVSEPLRILAAASGMSQGIGADGGYLVPPSFSTTIWEGLTGESNSLLSRCDVYTIPAGVDSITFPANAETSRADGYRWGGVRGYWGEGEAAQKTKSKPTFRQVKLEPREIHVFAYITNKLLRSAMALEQYLVRAATDEIQFKLGDAIIEGDGAGKPLGILNSGALVSVAKEIDQLATTFIAENAMNMFSRCHLRALPNAVWFINQDVMPQLMAMYLAVGTGGLPVYLPANGLSAAPFGTLLGRPVVPIEYMESLGAAGDVGLYDLSAYAVGMRGEVESGNSIHLRFDYNETAFRFVWEMDGQPWVRSAMTPFKGGANTVSPFVTTAVRE